MTATTVRPGDVVCLRDDTFGVVLDRGTSNGVLAVDLWHAGAVFVPSEEVVEVVVPEPGEGPLPQALPSVNSVRVAVTQLEDAL